MSLRAATTPWYPEPKKRPARSAFSFSQNQHRTCLSRQSPCLYSDRSRDRGWRNGNNGRTGQTEVSGQGETVVLPDQLAAFNTPSGLLGPTIRVPTPSWTRLPGHGPNGLFIASVSPPDDPPCLIRWRSIRPCRLPLPIAIHRVSSGVHEFGEGELTLLAGLPRL